VTLKRRLLIGLVFAGLCVLALIGLVAQLFGRGDTTNERSWA
jgi:hypothetical protein